jgi:hypothetical protein
VKKTLLLLLGMLMFLTWPLAAQIVTGAMVGAVEDSAGLAVADASVVATQVSTGRERTAVTDASGSFLLQGLEPGEYRIVASKTGFKHTEKRDLILPVGMRLPIGKIVLQVGALAETITVTAERGDIVQTQSSEGGDVITGSQLEYLQVIGRNAASLVQLLPGVVMTNDPAALDRNTTFSVLGGRNTSNNLSVNGVPGTDIDNGFDLKMAVSMDAVAEVRVLVSNYQAEFGRASGANIEIVTKSGTRTFHGLASYFKRHEQFNANNFFNNRLSLPISRYRYNTWNYNLGGPVYIPGVFNRNREKLFFFWSQEFWPNTTTALGRVTTPTVAERGGDFSDSRNQDGTLYTVRDPRNNKTPFPGNRIPADRLDASGVALLKIFPVPNFLDRSISRGSYNNVFTSELNAPKVTNTVKLDYNLNSSNQLFGSLSLYHEKSQGYLSVPGWSENWEQHQRIFEARNKALSLRYTRIVSPLVSNEFNFSWFSNPETEISPPAELKRVQRDQVGFVAGQFHPENNPLKLIPNGSFSSVPGAANLNISGRFPFDDLYRLFSWTDKLTLIRGPHTMKAGVNVERYIRGIGINSSQFGNFNFNNNSNNPLDTGYTYSNAALGSFYTYTESSAVPYHNGRGGRVELFVQDNWRATRRLTFDYGIRLYWLPPTYDRDDKMAGFVPGLYDASRQVQLIGPGFDSQRTRVGIDPVTGQIYPATLIGGIAPNSGNPANGIVVAASDPKYPRALYNNRGWQYGPRFGFAYDPFGKSKTAIRGGFGIFYNALKTQTWDPFTNQAPLVQNPVIYYGSLSSLTSYSQLLFPASVLGMDPSGKIPTVMNYSFSVQQSVGRGTVVSAAFVGALGRHLLWRRDLNAIPLGTDFNPANRDPTTGSVLPALFLYPRKGYTNIYQIEPAGTSNYNSMQVTANRRFTRGLQFGMAWTWSKALAYNDSDTEVVSSLVPVRVWNYGLSTIDRTHTVKLNWLYTLPRSGLRNPLARALLDNWQASGIATFQSGVPLAIGYGLVTGIDISGSPSVTARLNVIANPVLPKSERTFDRNFRTNAFQVAAVGTVGNAPKTVIRGPGVNNWDISAFKSFAVFERLRAQFRCEFYNAFNHTQFSALDTTARFDQKGNQISGTFGQFTAARNPRQIQFALRFTF